MELAVADTASTRKSIDSASLHEDRAEQVEVGVLEMFVSGTYFHTEVRICTETPCVNTVSTDIHKIMAIS